MRKLYVIFFALCFLEGDVVCKKSVTSRETVRSEEDALRVNQTVTYVIPKGEHYPTLNPLVFTSRGKITFYAVFDSSCIYKTVDPLNQNDINKLYGFSDCNTQHLINSARIGWRWSNGSLRIFAFIHNNSVMLSTGKSQP